MQCVYCANDDDRPEPVCVGLRLHELRRNPSHTDADAGGNPDPTRWLVTINVVSENGAQSFSPNPATLPAGQMVVWHNVDSVTHRVVLNNGSLDTGICVRRVESGDVDQQGRRRVPLFDSPVDGRHDPAGDE